MISTSKPKSLAQIKETYSEIFVRFEREVSEEARNSLEFHLNFFKSIQEKLKAGILHAELTSKTYIVFAQHFRNLIAVVQKNEADDLRQFDHAIEPSFKSKLKEEVVDQFTVISQWFRAEMQETAAMIDAIESVYHLESLRLKAESRLATERNSLLKIQLGKSSPLFRSKSKEERLTSSEEHIRALEKEIGDLQLILRIVQVRLTEYEFPRYKHLKAQKYELLLQTFSESHYTEIEALAAVLKEVSQS